MAGDTWDDFLSTWSIGDESAPVTDASLADDYLVEDAIIKFQEAAKSITDVTAALSSSRVYKDEGLQKLREAVTLAYSFALDGKINDVKKTLEKVLGI